MKTKAQRQFLKERQAYEKQLKQKARDNNLSLSEKMEWQQLSRNKYRENLFTADRIRRRGLLQEFLPTRIIFFIILISSFVFPAITSLINPGSNDSYYNDDYLSYETDELIDDPNKAIAYLSAVGNQLYDLYEDAQDDYETSQHYNIDYLHQLDAFTYTYYDFFDEELYNALNTLHTDILALSKLEYSDLPLEYSELQEKKAQIESSKEAFDSQVSTILSNLYSES